MTSATGARRPDVPPGPETTRVVTLDLWAIEVITPCRKKLTPEGRGHAMARGGKRGSGSRRSPTALARSLTAGRRSRGTAGTQPATSTAASPARHHRPRLTAHARL